MIRLEAAAGASGPVHGDEQGFPFRFHVDFLVFIVLVIYLCMCVWRSCACVGACCHSCVSFSLNISSLLRVCMYVPFVYSAVKSTDRHH